MKERLLVDSEGFAAPKVNMDSYFAWVEVAFGQFVSTFSFIYS